MTVPLFPAVGAAGRVPVPNVAPVPAAPPFAVAADPVYLPYTRTITPPPPPPPPAAAWLPAPEQKPLPPLPPLAEMIPALVIERAAMHTIPPPPPPPPDAELAAVDWLTPPPPPPHPSFQYTTAPPVVENLIPVTASGQIRG
ncbi:MAG: hypothetical protein U0792_17990 [Gemmataceae bacterium]